MRSILRIFPLFLSLAGTLALQAQHSVTWYFGQYGRVSISPTGIMTIPEPAHKMSTSEGSACVVDDKNKMVFYTDGVKVWNGAGVVQADGLGGNMSSTQSVIVVPQPGTNCRSYFIFTCAPDEVKYGQTKGDRGMRVSKATVSGNYPYTVTIKNGEKNINLLAGTPHSNDLISEKLCATSDGAGGFWVAAQGIGIYDENEDPVNTGAENKIFAAHISSATTDINTIQLKVTTNAMPVVYRGDYRMGTGQMKFSPSGLKIGMAFGKMPQVYLYDFNPVSGEFSNPMALNLANGAFDTLMDIVNSPYGLEFSANNKYVYVGCWRNLYQFDVEKSSAAEIADSRLTVHALPPGEFRFAALQRGPDNAIYIAVPYKSVLDRVVYPDRPATGNACNYVQDAIFIAGTCELGLPTVAPFEPCERDCKLNPALVCADTIACMGDTLFFTALNTGPADSIRWNFGDPSSPSNISRQANASHVYSGPGTFTAKLYAYICDTVYTLSKQVMVNPSLWSALGNEYFICNDDSELVKLDAGTGFASYLWHPTGDTSQWIIVKKLGSYYVVLEDFRGCPQYDSTRVKRRCNYTFFIPSAFTPNRNGINEVFKPTCSDVEEYIFEIYNTWGEKVFSSNDPAIGWDGTYQDRDCAEGVYLWRVHFAGYTKKSFRRYQHSGNVTLIR